jgi:hypothetical protein
MNELLSVKTAIKLIVFDNAPILRCLAIYTCVKLKQPRTRRLNCLTRARYLSAVVRIGFELHSVSKKLVNPSLKCLIRKNIVNMPVTKKSR